MFRRSVLTLMGILRLRAYCSDQGKRSIPWSDGLRLPFVGPATNKFESVKFQNIMSKPKKKKENLTA